MDRGDSCGDLITEESELIKKNSVYGANDKKHVIRMESAKGIDWNKMRTRQQQKTLITNNSSIWSVITSFFSGTPPRQNEKSISTA